MAVSFSTAFNGLHVKVFDVIATDDSDILIIIPHGLQREPFVSMVPLQQAVGELSAWALTRIDNTFLSVEKSTAAGSGNPDIQLRVTCFAQQAPVLG